MDWLTIILNVLFDGDGIIDVVTGIMFIIGLWAMFRKSGIPGWWALMPWAREYQLARCAGKELEGRATTVTSFLITVLGIIRVLVLVDEKNENLGLALGIFMIIFWIIHIVYSIQVYNGLTEVYGRRKLWIIAWVLFSGPTALLWGLHKKFQPAWQVEDFRASAVAHIAGHDIADVGEGLTVNLKERSVIEFFQKRQLLRDIHLQIKPGRLVMLLGGSGAGKTTFLNAINGYEKADAKVIINGRDVYKEYKKMQFETGFVPQTDLMRTKDTVWHTLSDYAAMRLPTEFTVKDRRARVDEALKIFGLIKVKDHLVEKLSGGQRKRLSIAMEFLSNPSLFILDEPDSGLDGVMARELFVQLRKVADTGRIVIVITHTPDRVIDLFDDVIILAKDSTQAGRLAFYGPVEECRAFFGKEKMEEVVKTINRPEEGGDGRADEFIMKYAEVNHV